MKKIGCWLIFGLFICQSKLYGSDALFANTKTHLLGTTNSLESLISIYNQTRNAKYIAPIIKTLEDTNWQNLAFIEYVLGKKEYFDLIELTLDQKITELKKILAKNGTASKTGIEDIELAIIKRSLEQVAALRILILEKWTQINQSRKISPDELNAFNKMRDSLIAYYENVIKIISTQIEFSNLAVIEIFLNGIEVPYPSLIETALIPKRDLLLEKLRKRSDSLRSKFIVPDTFVRQASDRQFNYPWTLMFQNPSRWSLIIQELQQHQAAKEQKRTEFKEAIRRGGFASLFPAKKESLPKKTPL